MATMQIEPKRLENACQKGIVGTKTEHYEWLKSTPQPKSGGGIAGIYILISWNEKNHGFHQRIGKLSCLQAMAVKSQGGWITLTESEFQMLENYLEDV